MEKDEGPAAVSSPERAPAAPVAHYLALTVTAPREAQEVVAFVLHEALPTGLVEEEGPPGQVRLHAYLPEDPAWENRLGDLRRRLASLPSFWPGGGRPTLELERVADESWATAWKAHYHAFRVTPRLWVVPTWEEAPDDPSAVAIRLDPGMAFGSGLHASTQLCLQFLETCLPPRARVADIGTGSGILAIAAAKLGAVEVTAVDHDAVAVGIARSNVQQNGVAHVVRVVQGDLFAPLLSPVDLILANLTADLLVRAAPRFRSYLHPGGVAIASGIVTPHVSAVTDAFARAGLVTFAAVSAAEWRALAARRVPTRKGS